MGGLRRCARCRKEQPCAAFGRHKGRPVGLQDYCKPCARRYAKDWDKRKRAERRALKAGPPVPPGHKRCRKCGEVKPHSEWDRNRRASDGLSTRCKACRAVEGREGHLKRQYGITVAERETMITQQNGLCPICLRPDPVHVDHCHKTGKVRGVLCFNCNSALGKLGDDPDAIRRAIAYPEGNVWKPTLEAPGVCQRPS
ncbi:endonuclease VII domain-containing protein [Streptomyces chattanoogensis]